MKTTEVLIGPVSVTFHSSVANGILPLAQSQVGRFYQSEEGEKSIDRATGQVNVRQADSPFVTTRTEIKKIKKNY